MKFSLLQKYVSRRLYNQNNQINYACYLLHTVNLLIKFQFSVDESCHLKFAIGTSMDDFPILFDARNPKTKPLKKSHSYFGCCNDVFLAIQTKCVDIGFGMKFYETVFQHHWACKNLRHCFIIISRSFFYFSWNWSSEFYPLRFHNFFVIFTSFLLFTKCTAVFWRDNWFLGSQNPETEIVSFVSWLLSQIKFRPVISISNWPSELKKYESGEKMARNGR